MSSVNADTVVFPPIKERSLANPRTDLATWFQQEHVALYRLALLLTGQRAQAEDLVQDTFVRLSLAGARPEREGIATYARRTLVNLHRSRLRRWYRERRAVERLSGRDQTTSPPVEPADPALFDALRHLPRMQRAAVALRFLEDRSIEETATILGVSSGAVKTHTHRGLASLRDRLGTDTDQGT